MTTAYDGLLVVRDMPVFKPVQKRIVIPRNIVDGLLTAIHFRFNHASQNQMRKIVSRYFYALDLEKSLIAVAASCHHCSSLKVIPHHLVEQSTSEPPITVGVSFAADVMRRYRQCILILRETVTSYTSSTLIPSESKADLCDGLLILCAEVRRLTDDGISIRVDPAPGFVSLSKDPTLQRNGINLVIGDRKNPNKNPVAEHAIRELAKEFLHLDPEGNPVSSASLALATSNLNSRIRHGGLSSRELWTQRDQINGSQLPLDDEQYIVQQYQNRTSNHLASSVSKAHGHSTLSKPNLTVGSLVYLYTDGHKAKARDKYIISSISGTKCSVRKFTKSQYRTLSYNVRLSDCYPIAPSASLQTSQDPVRGLQSPEHTDSSDDEMDLPNYQQIPEPDEIQLPAPPPPPDEIVAPPNLRPTAPRRRKKPAWQLSNEWLMDNSA